MVGSWYSREGEEVAVLGFARRAVAAFMSCFCDCFRTNVSYSHLISTSDSMVTRNKDSPSSLDLSDDDSLQEGGEAGNPLFEELDILKDEAKFLKACGTLPQTPFEIRKASRKWADTSAQREEEKSWTFKSWIPNASLEKLKLDKQPDESPPPVKLCEEWVTWTGFSTDSPSSGMAGEHNIRRDSTGSIQNVVTPTVFATSVHCKNKSVRFDCESDTPTISSKGSSSGSSSQDSERSASSGSFTLSKPSPYPTPLKLTDEMQTPGTVFPSYMKNMADGTTARIRSQYVYAGLNPVDYPSKWKVLKDENSSSNHLIESIKLNDEATFTSTPISDKAIKDLLVGQDMKNEASLSSWLEPQSANQDGYNELSVSISDENAGCGRISGDRPISESSTYMYKEDQKIGSHATPFEERLEEELSEDSLGSLRKLVGGTRVVDFNEAEEYDTAL
ncbi:hypothetical protein BUALT_Bualt18G0005100 [Buddleja alternifolia]|uniref:Uncharacterized protein n=1 Tax=Buddleja alternifolia TaxID=168488 RepID=A0AAV6W2T5_9LAMI|nr:hypothetical protein BUALT_Bualt18G0005100 [Buddleja alternifolia]